jgi:hypothetical protein
MDLTYEEIIQLIDSTIYNNEKEGISGAEVNQALKQILTYAGTNKGLIKSVKISLSSAQIRALKKEPVHAIPSPGVGKAIEMVSVIAKNNFNTVRYLNLASICFLHKPHWLEANINEFTQFIVYSSFSMSKRSVIHKIQPVAGVFDKSQLVDDEPIFIIGSDNGVQGDGTFDFFITYRVIDLLQV